MDPEYKMEFDEIRNEISELRKQIEELKEELEGKVDLDDLVDSIEPNDPK